MLAADGDLISATETPLTTLVLYHGPGSSSMAVHIALHEIGVPFETRLISFRRKETEMSDFRALNPVGQVPTLLIDDRPPLTEAAGCLFYLARRYPEANLLPAGAEAEARTVSWMSYIASTIQPARRGGLAHAQEVYRVADRRLGDSDWAVGTYSIADIHLFRLFWRVGAALQLAPGTLGNLSRHYDRMMARPAVQRAMAAEAAVGYDDLPEVNFATPHPFPRIWKD